jgi:hypothetical protein
MEAFDRKDYDHESHKTEGYEYIKFTIAMDSSQKFFDNYYIQDFEQTMKRKVERNDFKYALLNSDEYSYDKSWIHSENRMFDLDVDDSDIDHLDH